MEVNAGLIGLIVSQVHQLDDCFDVWLYLWSEFHSWNHQEQLQFGNNLLNVLPPSMCLSSWLRRRVCSIKLLHNFVHAAFCDTIALCYHQLPSACPTSCACGHCFTIEHALCSSALKNPVCNFVACMVLIKLSGNICV